MSTESVFTSDINEAFKVNLIKTWGTDKEIADIASISYGKDSAQYVERLLKYLIVNKHFSPFEHAGFTFYIKLPIFIARQLLRYRHISVNEMSRRYTTNTNKPFEFYIPNELNTYNDFSTSSVPLSVRLIQSLVKEYEYYIDMKIKPELARTILPVNLLTEMYLSVNIRELMHILYQRLESHAQKEITIIAKLMLDYFKDEFPISSAYFLELYKED